MAINVRLPEINFIVLAGRVVRDGEMFTTQSGISKCTMRIAVNRRVKDSKTGEWKDESFFIDVIAWREMADRSREKAKKGVAITVEGRLTAREYDDKTSGQKRVVFEVVANRLQFLSAADAAAEPTTKKSAADPEAIEEVPF